MLNSFKEQLKQLVIDPNDKFHLHLRKRVGKRATLLLEKRLKQIILLMPGVVARIYVLWERDKTPLQAKHLGGFLLAYMYHPKDFFPEQDYGLFGYLDDAYVAAAIYQEVLKDSAAAGIKIEAADEKLLKDLLTLKKAVKTVIPKEIEKIEKMIEEFKVGNQRTYLAMFKDEAVSA